MSLTKEQQEALLQQSLYTEGIDRNRILLGTSADLSQGVIDFMGNMAKFAPDPGQAARYRDLRGPDVVGDARRDAFVEDAAGEATARAQQQVRELPSKVDPTKSAALLQGLSGLEGRAQGARLKAETLAMEDRAKSEKLRAGEMSKIEDERAQKKLGRKLAKLNLFGDIFRSGFKGAAALKPKTYERKLEDQARKESKRSDKLATRQKEADTKASDLAGEAAETMTEGAYSRRGDRLADRAKSQGERAKELKKKSETFGKKAEGTKESLAALRAAEEEKQRKKLALNAQYRFGSDFNRSMNGSYGLGAAEDKFQGLDTPPLFPKP